ncbi:MAG: hypothetical protein AAF560_09955, partial [Acidobacteriota bacterium]
MTSRRHDSGKRKALWIALLICLAMPALFWDLGPPWLSGISVLGALFCIVLLARDARPALPKPQSFSPTTAGQVPQTFSRQDLEIARDQRHQPMNAHETEAARLAQLLVAEIKLYNEAHIAKGSKTSRIYTMLQDDIERSR